MTVEDTGMSQHNRWVHDWFTNWNSSDLPLAKRAALATRNLSKRLRGKPCCGHPGEPGC